MTSVDIKHLLKESIGLHADSVGDSSIDRAIRHRMNALGIAHDHDYLSCLKSSPEELSELIEEVVVPETWFFRNGAPFEALAKLLPGLLENSQNRFLRILSVPCSTGEEPYSIAMTLLECSRVGNFEFMVDSVDVSKRAINKAKRGVYGSYSFREGNNLEVFKNKYFQKEKNGFHLSPQVKQFVKLSQGNVLTDNIAPTPSYYDVIFCRNLFIYFDNDTQTRVLNKLGLLLKPSGVLFLGHAETSQVVNDQFIRIDIPKAFAFQKRDAKSPATGREKATANIKALEAAYQQLMDAAPAANAKSANGGGPTRKPRKSKASRQAVNQQEPADTGAHADVMRQIELGRLTEAAAECEKMLKDNQESSEAYYLLGLISHLEGNGGAAESLLKKAMYLDPNHHGALGLSALLAENRGDTDIALALRRREQRVLKRTLSGKPEN